MQKVFDAHFHIIDPAFPLKGNNGFSPEPYTQADYRRECQGFALDFVGGAVVSGSFQAYDQTYFAPTLKALGDGYVGVTQLPEDVSDSEILRLNAIGIRAVRFNLYRGLNIPIASIEHLAQRVYRLCGWSSEFYLNIATADVALKQLICNLPKASVDHLGMAQTAPDELRRFLAAGVPIRVTGFGRIDYSREELTALLPVLYHEWPQGLLFGTDLPATRARYRFSMADIELVATALKDQVALDNVMYRNAQAWYLS